MRSNYLFLGVLIAFVFATNGWGDRRSYVWTYQYMTIPQGKTELELYQTTRIAQMDFWEYRVEIEHGFTNRWDFSVYQIFSQNEKQALRWDAVQFRTRFKFEPGSALGFDPLFYFEYQRKVDFAKAHKIETRLVLARQLGKINVALNPLYEYFFAPGSQHELGLDVGTSFEFSPRFILGLESVTRLEFASQETELASYLGPVVSIASGEWWYTIGLIWGLNSQADTLRIRFLMGIGL